MERIDNLVGFEYDAETAARPPLPKNLMGGRLFNFKKEKVLPVFETGSLESESRV